MLLLPVPGHGAGCPSQPTLLGQSTTGVRCDTKVWEQGQVPPSNTSPGLVVEVRKSPRPGLMEQGWRISCSCRGRKAAGSCSPSLQSEKREETCRERCLRSSICRRAGLAPHLWKLPSTATAVTRSSPVVWNSGSPVLASGVAGLWLWAGWLYSHHFNKEMIKRGWGGGKENPKTSVLLQIREDSFACKECVNHSGLGDVHNPA